MGRIAKKCQGTLKMEVNLPSKRKLRVHVGIRVDSNAPKEKKG